MERNSRKRWNSCLEPRSRFLTRAHAPRTAIRLSGDDSANPTRTIGVLDNKLRTLPKT